MMPGRVRCIYRMYRDGYGMAAIAKRLHGEPKYRELNLLYFDGQTPPSPRQGRRTTGSWAPSSVRVLLHNERYIGKVAFGRHRNRYRAGTKIREKQAEFLHVQRDDHIIVPAELWEAVQQRLGAARDAYIRDTGGQVWGRTESGRVSKYLLSSFMRCGYCSANMVVTSAITAPPGKRRNTQRYICNYSRARGRVVCDNGHKPRMVDLDREFLQAVEQQVLTVDAVNEVARMAAEKVKAGRQSDPDRPAALRKSIAEVEPKLENLANAIADGQAPDTLVRQIRTLEGRPESLVAALQEYTLRDDEPALSDKSLEKQLRERLGRFQELLSSNPAKTRQALRILLDGPIRFLPKASGSYVLEARTKLGALLPPARQKGRPPSSAGEASIV